MAASQDRTKCELTTIGAYDVHELLGSGSFGDVKRVVHRESGREYACKIMSLHKIKVNNLGAQVKREISVLRQLDHVNVVKLIEVLKNKKHMFIICELVKDGDLFDKLVDCRHFTETKAREYFRQIIAGVSYCHSLGICHRDFKPENILLTEDGTVKIADFGFSNAFMSQGVEEELLMKTLCGTVNYLPSELLRHEKYSGTKADVYSLGIVLYFMVAGKLPFDQVNNDDLFAAIMAGNYEVPEHFSVHLQSLVQGMLNTQPADRFSMEQVRSHPWMMVKNQEIQGPVRVPLHIDLSSIETFDVMTAQNARQFNRPR